MSEPVTGNWFVVLTFDILTSKDLNDKQKLLLALISNLQNQRGYCYAGNQYLADLLNCSDSAIKESLRFLEEKGWLKRQVFRNTKREVTHRSMEIIMKKCHAPFDQDAPPLPEFRHTPSAGIPAYPSTGNPAYLCRNSGPIITKINNAVEAAVTGSLFQNPTLEQVKEFSAAAKISRLWCEAICQAMNFKSIADRPDLGKFGELFEWMDIFDLHISDSEEVKNLTSKRYRLLFTGWMRAKNSKGITLESYKKTLNINNDGGIKYAGSGQSSMGNGKNAQDQPGRTITHDRP